MVDFYDVTEIIARHPEWQTLLVNEEDGYIIYVNEDFPGIELTFADWDLNPDMGGAILRLTNSYEDDPQTGYNLCLVEQDIDELAGDDLFDTVEDFFFKCEEILY